jgi:hypothetical protein
MGIDRRWWARRLRLFATLGSLAYQAEAQSGETIDVPEAPGVTITLEPGTAGDPVQRVTAARAALVPSKGRPTSNTRPQVTGTTTRIAMLTERFDGEPQKVHGWMATSASPQLCHIIAPASEQSVRAMRPGVARCVQVLMQAGQGGAARGAIASQPDAPLRPLSTSPSDLKAALAVVPAANRPVKMVLRSGTSFSGGFVMPTFRAWMLFGDGWAVQCADWDPGVTDRATLPQRDCRKVRWREDVRGTAFEDAPGTWKTEQPSNLTPFSPGQRISVDLVNTSGAGTAVGAPGLAVSSLTSGQLRMTAEGQIATGRWTSVTVSGANVGGGSSSRRGPLVGHYYVDGHLIAIADAQGRVHRGFIAEDKGDGGPFIYLNGELFWPKRR